LYEQQFKQSNKKFIMKSGKVVLGVLAGLAAGAVLGILLAPDKGSETRKKISKKSSDTVDDLKEKLGGFTNAVTEKYESIKKSAEDFVSGGRADHDGVKKTAS
jgi:gas vesicle protein